MEISDQVGGFARFGSEQRTGAFDDGLRQPKTLRDGDSAGAAWHSDHQAVGGAKIYVVKFDGGIDHSWRGGSIGLEPIVVRGGEHDAILCAEFVEQRYGESRAFFGRGAGTHFVRE